jgi:hypothetical protein
MQSSRRKTELSFILLSNGGPPVGYSQRDIQITARALKRRHDLGALRHAESQVRRFEKTLAYEAAVTWKQLIAEIRNDMAQSPLVRRPLRRSA